jgi:hypothetical protein
LLRAGERVWPAAAEALRSLAAVPGTGVRRPACKIETLLLSAHRYRCCFLSLPHSFR